MTKTINFTMCLMLLIISHRYPQTYHQLIIRNHESHSLFKSYMVFCEFYFSTNLQLIKRRTLE